MKQLLGVGVILCAMEAWAQAPQPVPAQEKEKEKPRSALTENCHDFLSNPVGGELYYDPKSVHAYVLSYVGDKQHQADDWANVIDVNLKKKEGYARAALQLNRTSNIVGYQQPATALTIFTFSEDPLGCNVGQGSGVSFPLNAKPVLQRTYGAQEYEMIRTDAGISFVDRKTDMIRELDFTTMQRKLGRKVPPDDRVLFWREKDLRLTALTLEPKKALYRLNVVTGKKEGEVRLRPQQEVLQDGDAFAFVEREAKGNFLNTQYVPTWSGYDHSFIQKYVLPDGYPVENAAMTWDSKVNRILMWGKFPLRTKQWNKAFLFSGESQKPIATFDVPKNQYVSSALLIEGEPLLLLKNRDTQNLSGLMLRDKKTGKFAAIRLLLKERPGEKLEFKEGSPTAPASPKAEGK